MESREIYSVNERPSNSLLDYYKKLHTKESERMFLAHKALEAAETQIEKLEAELHAEIKLRMQREEECKEEFHKNRELLEENTKLKELIVALIDQHKIRLKLDDGAELPGWAISSINKFFKSHNIGDNKQ